MDEQRKRVYGFRQSILNGVNCKTKIVEMMDEQINKHLDEFLAKDREVCRDFRKGGRKRVLARNLIPAILLA